MTNGISPKLVAAVVTAILTYVLGQELLELPPVAVVAGQAVLVALAAWRAPAGDVTPLTAGSNDDRLDETVRHRIGT